ncbi:MAG: hypothetical protein QF535_11655 [Anaerolineales bacterium]|jgi:phage I-like protein|nr:hypothetical protein [Anaerolineales bacterium]
MSSDISHAELNAQVGEVRTDVAVLTQKVTDHMVHEEKHQKSVNKQLDKVITIAQNNQRVLDRQRGMFTIVAGVFTAMWALILTSLKTIWGWFTTNG